MLTTDFDYDLPSEAIAQKPVEPRDASRLLVMNRQTGKMIHTNFYNLGNFLSPGDALIFNETRVFRARLFGRKIPTGGKVEILLIRRRTPFEWEALIGGKRSSLGLRITFDSNIEAAIVSVFEGSRRLIRFNQPIEAYLEEHGHTPLPPYIHEPLADSERYQTVYARELGSAAAPTAGLHFTHRLIEELKVKGVRMAWITLHVGLDTFAPVNESSPDEHIIHSEWCQLPPEAAAIINQTTSEGGRIIAVGTTSVRTLESAALHAIGGERVASFNGSTNLFIIPGYQFKAVDAMITNFHLPRSTLIMLVSAFAGREKILQAYHLAIEEGYRFYSFGDAMLIV